MKLNFLVDQFTSLKKVSKLRLAADLIVKGISGYKLLSDPKNVLEILISNNFQEIKKTVEVAIVNSFEIYNLVNKFENIAPGSSYDVMKILEEKPKYTLIVASH